MSELAARIRSSARALWRAPGFAVPAIVSLACGLGVALPLLGLVRPASIVPPRLGSPLALERVEEVAFEGIGATLERTAAQLQDAAFEVLLALLATVALLTLTVACTNAAILLLGRGSARRREIAVRRALGAGRRRIVPAHLLEGSLLALAAGAAGVALGSVAALVLRGAWPHGLVDGAGSGTAGAYAAAGLALLAVTACAAASPLLVGWARDLRGALAVGDRATAGRRETALRNALVVVQFAAALALVTGAGLLARNSLPLSDAATLGYDPRDTLVVRLAAEPASASAVRETRGEARPRSGGAARTTPAEADARSVTPRVHRRIAGATDAPRPAAALDALAARVRRLESVREAGVGTPGAWLGLGPVGDLLAECRCVRGGAFLYFAPATARHQAVGPGFFRALGVPLIAGRTFTEADLPDSPRVAIVNEAFARANFPRRPFVGREIFIDRRGEPYTVVGVVGDVRTRGIGAGRGAAPTIYLAVAQHPPRSAALLVRVDAEAGDVAPAIRSAVARTAPAGRSADPAAVESDVARAGAVESAPVRAAGGFTVASAVPLLDELARFAAPIGWFGGVFAGLAALALLLATYGLFTATRLHVARRTREIGVRMALGARRWDVLAATVRDGARLAGLGLTLGFFAAVALARAFQLMFDGVRLVDPLLLGGVAAALAGAVLVATFFAARRAARVDPAVALRGE